MHNRNSPPAMAQAKKTDVDASETLANAFLVAFSREIAKTNKSRRSNHSESVP